MIQPIPEPNRLRTWFAGLVESSFQSTLGVCDPSLSDYLVNLLVEFLHVERINSLTDGSGRRVEDVTDMLYQIRGASENGPEEARLRLVHRHIGDYTLFWTGVYPENLRHLHRRNSRDDLISYFRQGKRSYAIAAQLSNTSTQPPAGLLRQLSDEFESCVYGLGLVRKEWEQASGSSPPRVIS